MLKIEACVGDVRSALLAIELGADRVELSEHLAIGGLTPGYVLIKELLQAGGVEAVKRLIVLIRPRPGDFTYSDSEKHRQLAEMELLRDLPLLGFAVGALTGSGQLDLDFLTELKNIAEDKELVMHRAFDFIPAEKRINALESLAKIGFTRVLTSGGERDSLTGSAEIARLCRADILPIVAAGGIRSHNVMEIVKQTTVREIHLSASRIVPQKMGQYWRQDLGMGQFDARELDPEEFERVVKATRQVQL